MKIIFHKYHGAGNDFIMVDNRTQLLPRHSPELYAQWCHRRFGIGADGVILLQNHAEYDFEMVYYNADGCEGSMCGNGGRCIAAFAKQLEIVQEKMFFWAADGLHAALLNDRPTMVSIQMKDVVAIQQYSKNDWILNTGSPHYVRFVNHLAQIDVLTEGRLVRNAPNFSKEGINVNFVEINNPFHLKVATYERGVEDETYACGTGVVACCIAAYCHVQSSIRPKSDNEATTHQYEVETKGGPLSVSFKHSKPDNHTLLFSDIWLTGGATHVFSGQIDLAI